jgi:adenine C2-methylase RlmN of 23S rRNA A2503 and tRNA A37
MVKERRTQDNLPLKSIWDTGLVTNAFREVSASPKHAYKIWNYLIKNPDKHLSELPYQTWNCSKKASNVLKEDFSLFTSKVVQSEVSSRGDTTKLLVELQDGHRVLTTLLTALATGFIHSLY